VSYLFFYCVPSLPFIRPSLPSPLTPSYFTHSTTLSLPSLTTFPNAPTPTTLTHPHQGMPFDDTLCSGLPVPTMRLYEYHEWCVSFFYLLSLVFIFAIISVLVIITHRFCVLLHRTYTPYTPAQLNAHPPPLIFIPSLSLPASSRPTRTCAGCSRSARLGTTASA
jgi:hypothetical protein